MPTDSTPKGASRLVDVNRDAQDHGAEDRAADDRRAEDRGAQDRGAPNRGAADRGVQLRPAWDEESDAVADLMFAVRQHNVGAIPAPVHSLDDMRRWMRAVAFINYDVWVADHGGRLVGFMALSQPNWLEHLYVESACTGQGLGSRFVELAKRALGGEVQLWTFQSNLGARRFYERHGFVPVEWTDADNEEQAPDVRYVFSSR